MTHESKSPASVCPLCKETNECAMEKGLTHCWCYNEVIPQSVLDRIPETKKNLACICRKCALSANNSQIDV